VMTVNDMAAVTMTVTAVRSATAPALPVHGRDAVTPRQSPAMMDATEATVLPSSRFITRTPVASRP
jgi:hypothetical protein